jgi:BASS family bile acid:Na+ symporter
VGSGSQEHMSKTDRLVRLLGDPNFLFVMAIVLGITLGPVARWTQSLTLPALAVAMTVSTTQVASSAFRPLRKLVRPMLLSVVLNYLVLSTVILILARWLVPERELWIGFVLSAAAPPGVAVIPFSYILGGDTAFALIGTVGAYLAALVITPAMALLLVGESFGDPVRLATVLLELVVLPLVLSRLLLARRLKGRVERWRGKIVNWAFFLVVFTIIGLNQDVFLREPQLVVLISIITVARSFGLAFVLERLLKRLRVERATRVSYVLMGTLKNGGFAAGTALALFGQRASVPAGVGAAIAVPYLLWLAMRWGDGKG